MARKGRPKSGKTMPMPPGAAPPAPASRVFPLHCGGGVERAAFAYGSFLLNRDIAHLLHLLRCEPLGQRHTVANLALLVKSMGAAGPHPASRPAAPP